METLDQNSSRVFGKGNFTVHDFCIGNMVAKFIVYIFSFRINYMKKSKQSFVAMFCWNLFQNQ